MLNISNLNLTQPAENVSLDPGYMVYLLGCEVFSMLCSCWSDLVNHDENSDNDSRKLKADNIASPDDFDQTDRDHADTDQNVSR